MERSWWPPFAKFCKNHFQLFLIAKHAEKSIMLRWQIPPECPAFVMATIREILQKLFPTFFKRQARRKKHYVTMAKSTVMCKAKESAVSWWQIRDGHHLQNFAKMSFDFFLSLKQSKRKRSVMKANSRCPPFANFCKNDFRLFLKP